MISPRSRSSLCFRLLKCFEAAEYHLMRTCGTSSGACGFSATADHVRPVEAAKMRGNVRRGDR